MNPFLQKLSRSHANPRRSGALPDGAVGDSSQEAAGSRVLSSTMAMFLSLPCGCTTGRGRARSERLVNAVITAFVEGDLKPGDPFPEPCELAHTCHMPRHEVLVAIGHLLVRRVLQQDRSGALRIHPRAAPTIEMKQQAFLSRARQLVDEAHRWHLPDECLDPLFHRATHHGT